MIVDAVIATAAALAPVFRVRPRDKRPMRPGWQSEASSDPAEIARLWRAKPDTNVGLLCGVAAWALDVDGDEGLATLADLEDLHRWLPVGPASITGTGGQHLFFQASDRVRNSVRRLGPGLDTRGKGGFVVLPPSVHPNGRRYAWLPGREPWTAPLPEAPAWLLDLLDPPRPAYRAPPPVRVSSRYVEVAMARELERVALAGEGERNSELFAAAASLGRFVASGDLGEQVVAAALVGVAEAAGLSRHEAQRTTSSGLRRSTRAAA